MLWREGLVIVEYLFFICGLARSNRSATPLAPLGWRSRLVIATKQVTQFPRHRLSRAAISTTASHLDIRKLELPALVFFLNRLAHVFGKLVISRSSRCLGRGRCAREEGRHSLVSHLGLKPLSDFRGDFLPFFEVLNLGGAFILVR